MTTASELAEAVRPCLPLPGIGTFVPQSGGLYIFIRDEAGTLGSLLSTLEAEQRIIGAIWQACVERGWSCAMHGRLNAVSITRGPRDYKMLGEADGTCALALCKAFAAAKETP